MIVPNPSAEAFFLSGGVFSEPWLLDAALATAVIETPIFWFCGYRRCVEDAWFFVVNIVSNLLLNEFIDATPIVLPYPCAVFLGEIFVVLLEFALCSYVVEEKKGANLSRVLLLTNAASFLAGVVYFMM